MGNGARRRFLLPCFPGISHLDAPTALLLLGRARDVDGQDTVTPFCADLLRIRREGQLDGPAEAAMVCRPR
jgi:hypothetical protein